MYKKLFLITKSIEMLFTNLILPSKIAWKAKTRETKTTFSLFPVLYIAIWFTGQNFFPKHKEFILIKDVSK